jgi:hypothetical protein
MEGWPLIDKGIMQANEFDQYMTYGNQLPKNFAGLIDRSAD